MRLMYSLLRPISYVHDDRGGSVDSSMMSSKEAAGISWGPSKSMHSSSSSAGVAEHRMPSMMYCEYKADSFTFMLSRKFRK